MSVPALRFKDDDGRGFPDWSEKKLGEVGRVLMCKRILKEQTQPFGDVPFYKIGTFGKQADAYISNEVYKSYKERFSFPKKGDILISAAGTIGRTVIYDGLSAYFQDSNIVWIDNNEELVKNSFLYFIYDNVTWNTENTTIARLYNENLRSILINVPSLSEQTKIAHFFTAVDEKIQHLTQKADLLAQYKKGVMQQIFSQELRFKDDDGSEFPEWEETKLENIATFLRGGTLSKSDIFEDGKFECVHYGELFTIYKEVINVVRSKTNVMNTVNSEYGDILMPTSDVTPAGLARASCLLKSGIVLGSDINIVRVNTGIEPIFISYLLNFENKKIIQLVSGTTVKHIYIKDIKTIDLSISKSSKEQTKIANFLTAIDDKITQTQTQLAAVKQYKQGLLQQMFV